MAETFSARPKEILAGLTLVVGVIGFVFGNGLVDRLNGPDLVVQRTVTDIPWPQAAKDAAMSLAVSRGTADLLEQGRSVAHSGAPLDFDLDRCAGDLARHLPGITMEKARGLVTTAYLLNQFGVVAGMVAELLRDKRNVFPDKIVVLRIVNLGGRIARNVEVTVKGDFRVADTSVEGPTNWSRCEESPAVGLTDTHETVVFRAERLPAGEHYAGVATLWVGRNVRPPDETLDWLSVTAIHDEGKGAGRVVDGVAVSTTAGLVRAVLRVLASLLVTCAAVALFLLRKAKRERRRQASAVVQSSCSRQSANE
jgi:hypothetical protein